MKEPISKEDLWQFAAEIIREVKKISLPRASDAANIGDEWLKSKAVRKILDISPGTLQNIRVTGKYDIRKFWGLTTIVSQIYKNCLRSS